MILDFIFYSMSEDYAKDRTVSPVSRITTLLVDSSPSRCSRLPRGGRESLTRNGSGSSLGMGPIEEAFHDTFFVLETCGLVRCCME